MDGFENQDERFENGAVDNYNDQHNEELDARREEVFSKAVRAGKRTYFFDVKATRSDEYFLTITESKKRFRKDGKFFYEKHKIFLYKEDFLKFAETFQETIDFIKETQGLETTFERSNEDYYEQNNISENENSNIANSEEEKKFLNIDFDDLNN